MLSHLAEQIRAGAWNSEIAEIVSRVESILKLLEAEPKPESKK